MIWRFLVIAACLVTGQAYAQSELAFAPPKEFWREKVAAVILANQDAAAEHDDPLAAGMTVCRNTACLNTDYVTFSEDEILGIRQIMAGPGAEIDRITQAIALFETYVGAKNGTWRDLARNEHPPGPDRDLGQMDCVAESANTSSYLDRLYAIKGLSRYRMVGLVHRYQIVLQHVAVEIQDMESGDSLVVDSWVGANGEPPLVEPWFSWRMRYES